MVRIEEILGGPPRQHSIMDNVLQRRGECLQPESAGLARHNYCLRGAMDGRCKPVLPVDFEHVCMRQVVLCATVE